MCLYRITTGYINNLLLSIEHHIDNKINTQNPACFLNVHSHRITLKITCTRSLIYHQTMIISNSLNTRNTWHNSLIATRIACKIMILNIAKTDSHIRLYNSSVNINRCMITCIAKMHKIFTVRIKTVNCAIHLTHKMLMFFYGLVTVRTPRKDDKNIFTLYATLFKLFYN